MTYSLFSAPWCTYCTPVKTLIQDTNMPVTIIDIDQDFEAATKAGVKGIPALLFPDGTLMTESKVIMEFLRKEFLA